MNYYKGSFLDYDKEGFDIIVGNPPYNSDGGLKTGGKNLYQKFINKSINIYKQYILFITPPGFYKTTNFNKSNEIFNKITSNNSLIYLNSFSNISDKYFNVGSLIVYYLIKKEKYHITQIVNEYGNFNIDISKFNFIPRLINNEIYTILKKISTIGEKMKISRDDNARKKINKFITLSTLNHLNDNGKWNVSVGSVTNRKRIIIEHNKPCYLVTLLNLKLYRFCFFVYRHDGAVYHNFINGFNIPINLNKSYTDQELYKYFNLNKEEINLIENSIK